MSIYIKSALCALAAAVVAPIAYLLMCASLDDRVTALGAFVRSDSGDSQTLTYGGIFALFFVMFPVVALLGAINAAWVWRREWSLRARRGWSAIFAILSAVCVAPLAYAAPLMISSNWALRAIPASSSANTLAHCIVNFESWSPMLWAVALCASCLWHWKAAEIK